MDHNSIQLRAKELQREIWRKQDLLWPNQQVTALQMLCPAAACEILGLKYLELESIGGERFSYKGVRYKVAGLIDRQSKKIAVSREFPLKTVRFTAAHEIGHWLLHHDEVIHRDRPVDGSKANDETRPRQEREADYFAACFLMPPRLLGTMFEGLFLTPIPFIVDDATAFHLNPSDPDALIRSDQDSLDREFALARCTSFNGRFFRSLAEQFSVSDSAMALRIKELKLIRWP